MRLLIRSKQARWHGEMPGASHDDAGTVVVGARLVVTVDVLELVDVVAPSTVDVEVDVVVDVVVVGGGIGFEQEFRQMRAMLFCCPVLRGLSHVAQLSESCRRYVRRQFRSLAFWPFRHFLTQLAVIVQRPPLFDWQRGLFAIAATQSSKKDCPSGRHAR